CRARITKRTYNVADTPAFHLGIAMRIDGDCLPQRTDNELENSQRRTSTPSTDNAQLPSPRAVVIVLDEWRSQALESYRARAGHSPHEGYDPCRTLTHELPVGTRWSAPSAAARLRRRCSPTTQNTTDLSRSRRCMRAR